MLHRRRVVVPLRILVFFLVVSFVLLGLFRLLWEGRLLPGIRISRLRLGSLSLARAWTVLEGETVRFLVSPLLLEYEERSWRLIPAELNVRYETDLSVQRAYSYGRSGAVLPIPALLRALTGEVGFPLPYRLDVSALEASFSAVEADIAFPSVPPSIEVLDKPDPSSGSRVVVFPGEPGMAIDRSSLRTAVHDRLMTLRSDPVKVQTVPLPAWQGRVDPDLTRGRAELLLPKQMVLRSKEESDVQTSWKLVGEDLVHFLSFDGDYQTDRIASYSATLAESIDRPPRNAIFEVLAGRVVEFAPDRPGLALDVQATAQVIHDALVTLESGEQTSVTVEVPVNSLSAAVTAAQINSLGIEELLGRGVSTFHGSIANREHNIAISAARITGILVPPDGTFSFNDAVGDISAVTGFRQAYIIRDGRTILDDGGGVCQVSTTLFRAVLAAGLPVLERHAHSYRVAYYEQNEKPGLDATVFAPNVDLKFLNDTPAHLLIQTTTDTAANRLVVEIYGTSDGRVATVSNHRIWDVTPPPPELYQDDPTLPAGTTKQVDWKAWGAKVKFDYSVERNGKIIFEKTFYSNFRPWQSVYLRGTGG